MLRPFEVSPPNSRSLSYAAVRLRRLLSMQGKESEHNWSAREQAIQRVRGMLKGDVLERYPDTFLHGLKNGFMDASLKTVRSIPRP